jgi:hypothetical protein
MTTDLKKSAENRDSKKDDIKKLTLRLVDLPCNSDEYFKVLKKIQDLDKASYNDQHILVVPRRKLRVEFPYDITEIVRDKEDNPTLFHGANILQVSLPPGVTIYDRDELNMAFIDLKMDDLFCKKPIARFMSRAKIEYDINYKQVMTFGYIRDTKSNKLIMLKNSERVGFIGGHTDFSTYAYSHNIMDILLANLYKEMLEEVLIYHEENGDPVFISTAEKIEETFNIQVKWFINSEDNFYDLRNCGLIYELTLKNEDDFDKLVVTTNEPIHDVYTTTIQELSELPNDESHSWVKYVSQQLSIAFEKSEINKDNYENYIMKGGCANTDQLTLSDLDVD